MSQQPIYGRLPESEHSSIIYKRKLALFNSKPEYKSAHDHCEVYKKKKAACFLSLLLLKGRKLLGNEERGNQVGLKECLI